MNQIVRYINKSKQINRFIVKTSINRPIYTINAIRDQKNEENALKGSKTSLLVEISNAPGSLHDLLAYFWKYDVDLTHIESRPTPRGSESFLIYLDFEGRANDNQSVRLLADITNKCKSILILDEKEVPWFPRHISDLDLIANRTLDAGLDLQADHPGFNDPVYRQRRATLAQIALSYKHGDDLPYIDYTTSEQNTWTIVYDTLSKSHHKYACSEYLTIIPMMEQHCGYNSKGLPQVRDISKFLYDRTGFRIRPVAGLLSSRDFLNGLAFRVFFSTQYIRHSSKPLYTPEPDICHELLGHAPMFADKEFADFSQEIGLASLGASDNDISRLATCYWHSVEFGLVKDDSKPNGVAAYGAGLLSSFGELEYACSGKDSHDVGCLSNRNKHQPDYLPWDPEVACTTSYPITTYQPNYFVAESISHAKQRMRLFCEGLSKPFYARYNDLTSSVWVDRAVRPKPLNITNNYK